MPIEADYLNARWELNQTVTYTFDVSSYGYGELSADERTQFASAVSLWSSVANLSFAEAADAGTADWRVGWYWDSLSGVRGSTISFDYSFDRIFQTDSSDYSRISFDRSDAATFYSTAIHEAGHALGLRDIDHTASVMSSTDTTVTALTDYDIEVIRELYGERGTDGISRGTAGDDLMGPSAAMNVVSGADGRDTLSGGAGSDILYGNHGTDLILGGDDDDVLYGGQNDGTPSGSPLAQRDGWDTLSGGLEEDLIYGNHGSDLLVGGEGNDTIFGGQNDDSIIGGVGRDRLYGNLGNDTFVYADAHEGYDVIWDFDPSGDRLELTGALSVSSISTIGSTATVTLSSGTSIFIIGISGSDLSGDTDYFI